MNLKDFRGRCDMQGYCSVQIGQQIPPLPQNETLATILQSLAMKVDCFYYCGHRMNVWKGLCWKDVLDN